MTFRECFYKSSETINEGFKTKIGEQFRDNFMYYYNKYKSEGEVIKSISYMNTGFTITFIKHDMRSEIYLSIPNKHIKSWANNISNVMTVPISKEGINDIIECLKFVKGYTKKISNNDIKKFKETLLNKTAELDLKSNKKFKLKISLTGKDGEFIINDIKKILKGNGVVGLKWNVDKFSQGATFELTPKAIGKYTEIFNILHTNYDPREETEHGVSSYTLEEIK